EVKVASKSSPDRKVGGSFTSAPEGVAAAPYRRYAAATRPRRLSHVLIFTPDIDASIEFYARNLGLRRSDRAEVGAFMHRIHGSDHHLLAFAKSDAAGFHHCSWDVGSLDDIGIGAAHMADKGYIKGWGLGRHVLGSNYFHYVMDPWGSFSEYSCDIDYIPRTQQWQAQRHKAGDAFSLWGPEPPHYFRFNAEAGQWSRDRVGLVEAVEEGGAAHVFARGPRIVGDAAQVVEVFRAHGWIALLHQTLVGDRLLLNVFDRGVPALAAVEVE